MCLSHIGEEDKCICHTSVKKTEVTVCHICEEDDHICLASVENTKVFVTYR